MDPVTLGMAKAAAKREYAAPKRQPYNLTEKLRRGREAAVFAVLGDSTGNGDDEWVHLTCEWLAEQYPNYNVRYFMWNDVAQTLGSGSYNSPISISAGIARPTITDDFTRADGAPGSTPSGDPYLSVTNMVISGNKLMTTSTAGSSVNIDPGQLDYTISVACTVATSASSLQRIYLRQSTDGRNSLFAEVSTGGAATFYLYKRVDNVTTTVQSATVAAITAGATVTVSATVAGNAFSATTGATTLSGTLSHAERDKMGDATRAGLWIGASITGAAFDDLSITRPALTIDCYNASVAGQVCDYGTARVNAMIPVPADLVLVNYGHNEPGQDCRPQYLKLGRSILERVPRAQLISISQNPRGPADPLYKDGLLKNTSIVRLTSREGWGFVDVTGKFLANPDYVTDWLNVDILHPNAAGSQAWADEVIEHLKDRPPVAAPSGASRVDAVRFFGPTGFVAVEDSPTMAVISGKALAWTFSASTQQAVLGTVHFPASWVSINIYLLLLVETPTGLNAGTNGTVWQVSTSELGDAMTTIQGNLIVTASGAVLGIPSTAALAAAPNVTHGLNNASTDNQYVVQAATALRLGGRPISLRVRRVAADAADTFAGTTHLMGVIVERAN